MTPTQLIATFKAGPIFMSFGTWLYDKRKAANKSQDELAELAGCSKNYISILERNAPHTATGALPTPSRRVVIAIADALGVARAEALDVAGYAPADPALIDIADRDPVYAKVGDRIRRRREELGLMPEDVAHHLRMAARLYAQYETGETALSLNVLVKIAKYLTKPTGWFFEDLPDMGEDDREILAAYNGAAPDVRGAAKLLLWASVQQEERRQSVHGRKAE